MAQERASCGGVSCLIAATRGTTVQGGVPVPKCDLVLTGAVIHPSSCENPRTVEIKSRSSARAGAGANT